MQNVLIITSYIPYPLTSGGNQAQFYIDNYLRQHFNLHLLYNENKTNDKKSANSLKEKWPDVILIPYNWKNKEDKITILWNKLLRRLTPRISKSSNNLTDLLPYPEISESFIETVNHAIDQYKIDLVQIEFYQFMPIVAALPHHVKKVFIQHEIQYVRNNLQKEVSGDDNKNMSRFVSEILKDYEISLMNRYDVIVTLTDIDKKKLLFDGVTTRIEASPACVTDKIYKTDYIPTGTNVVFIGGEGHYPNYDGLCWFLDEVWNDILNEDPLVKLSIVGKWSDDTKNAYTNRYKSVRFLGYVDDISTVLSNSIMIVPIRIGSGMRMKIVEAANIGCPFVATSVGVEGLNFEPETDFLLADSPNDYKDQLLRLLHSKVLQNKFSENIKRIYRNQYSISVLGTRRAEILESI